MLGVFLQDHAKLFVSPTRERLGGKMLFEASLMKVKSTGKKSPGVPQVTVDRRQGGATSFAILSKQSSNQVLKRCI